MKRAITAALLVVGLGASASAQIIRPTVITRPSAYASLSIGWLTQQPICDPKSNSCWNFTDAAQYRATFEVPISMATSIGVSYAHANVPLLWADSTCFPCQATSEAHRFMGLIHLGSTGAFSQLIDISAGATRFANFKTTAGAPLGNGTSATDFSFAVAYGFGIRMTQGLYFTLQQEYGVAFHKRMPSASSGTSEQRILLAGLRLAM